jgi:tRNA(Ile)-lysidine synthase
MLSTSREQLEAWVRAQGLAWIEDDSNADESLNRNYLRRRVLPLLQARWPGAATAVARSARHAAEAQSLLDRLARADIERASYGESLSVKALRALPADRLNNALRFWIARAGLRVPDTRRLAEITGPLLKAREDANPFVEWGEEEGARAQRDGDLLTLTRHGARAARRPTASSNSRPAPTAHPAANDSGAGAHTPAVDSVPSPPPPPAATELPDLIWSWRQSPRFELPHPLGKLQLEPDAHGPIDLDALPHPLTIRWRRGGERLAPRRGGPRRPLKSLLQESHIPASQRRSLPLLFSSAAPSTVPSTPITTPTVATPGASSAPRTPSAPAASGAPSTFSAPGALIAPTTSASAARSGSTASTASTPAVEKLIAVADLLLDETVQATSTTRRRARLRWMKSSP